MPKHPAQCHSCLAACVPLLPAPLCCLSLWLYPLRRHEALEAFKAGQGAAKALLLEENRSRLKASKRRAKELGLGINGAKRELDALKSRADELKQQRQAQQGDGAQVGRHGSWYCLMLQSDHVAVRLPT